MPYVAPGAYRASAGFPCSGSRSQDPTSLLLDGVFLKKIAVLGRPWDLIDREQSGSKGLSKMKSELNQEYLDIFKAVIEIWKRLLECFHTSIGR